VNLESQAADLLDSAVDILEQGGWCQGVLHHPDGRHCALGAIIRAASPWGFGYSFLDDAVGVKAALAVIGSTLSPDGDRWQNHWRVIADWNNAPERTEAEVKDALRHAAMDLRNEAIAS
jgi:hypothetical protein